MGAGLAPGFALAARVRRGKPLHPRGVVLPATLHRHGSARAWGVPWLDEPGTGSCTVRLSRSLGLPAPLPDVLGLALRSVVPREREVPPETGAHDLLLATTGLGRASRFVLVPRRDPLRSAHTSLMPYRTLRGELVLLAAVPVAAPATTAGGPAFELRVATPRGPWEPFAVLRVDGWPGDADDADVAFDPVRHPPPGLAVPPWTAALREPSYAAARRGRSPRPARTGRPPATT